MQHYLDQFDLTHWAFHAMSVTAMLGAIVGLFPALAALAACIWYGVQIYESRTVQHAVNNWLQKRRAIKVFRLRAKATVLAAEIEALEKVRAAKREARELVETVAATTAKVTASAEASINKTPPSKD